MGPPELARCASFVASLTSHRQTSGCPVGTRWVCSKDAGIGLVVVVAGRRFKDRVTEAEATHLGTLSLVKPIEYLTIVIAWSLWTSHLFDEAAIAAFTRSARVGRLAMHITTVYKHLSRAHCGPFICLGGRAACQRPLCRSNL